MSAPTVAPTTTDSLLAHLANGHVDVDVIDVAIDALREARWPLSLPGLCNRLWFERGTLGGYDGSAFGTYMQFLPSVAHQSPGKEHPSVPQEAVPLGALIKVEIGDDEAWGELVWKEGAHRLVGSDWVPGWLAGAPAGLPYDRPPARDFAPAEGLRVLRERMVVDFSCFGAEFIPTESKLARLRRKGKRLDHFGHLVAEVAYDDGLDEADEIGFWATWTAGHHPVALQVAGIAPDASVLAEAASILAAALAERDDVRSFGPYYLHADLYRQIIERDAAADGPLRHAIRGLARVPHLERVAWASMSARLAATAEEDALVGTEWPTAVVCASLLTLDTLADEAADGDWNGVHLRLDDVWQGGGLWRAETLGTTSPVAADPAVALGLGWVSYTGGTIERVADSDADDFDVNELDDDGLTWELTDSDVTWTTHLSTTDLDNDRLRVPRRVSELVTATLQVVGQSQILVVCRHDGHPEKREFSSVDGDGHLEVAWPLGVWPGTTVRVTWPLERTIVTAETRMLAEADQVGDIVYTHEFNLAVALAAAGLAERVTRTATISQLVRAAVRRHGEVTEDGRVGLGIDDLVTFCFGPEGLIVPGYGPTVLRRAVLSAVGAMHASGIANLEGDLVVISDRHTTAGRRADSDLLARFVDAQRNRLRRAAYRHFVPATVVNLSGGRRRSPAKEDEWADVAGTDYLPDSKLADNQTWRRRHIRGQGTDPQLIAQLDRAKEAIRRLGGDESVTASIDDVVEDPFAVDTPAEAKEAPASSHQSQGGL